MNKKEVIGYIENLNEDDLGHFVDLIKSIESEIKIKERGYDIDLTDEYLSGEFENHLDMIND